MRGTVTRLDSGWLLVKYGNAWAQVPPDFDGDTIPDEYIFDPDWNRERVNTAWRERPEREGRGRA